MKKYITLYCFFALISCSTKNTDNLIVDIKKDTSLNNTVQADVNPSESHSIEIKKDDTAHIQKQNSSNSSIQFKAPDLAGKDPKIKTYPIGKDGWGYDIIINEKVFIAQPNIPAINGNIPFNSSQDAERVAALMIFKIKNNINPPSVSIKELDSLNIKR